MLSTKRRWFAAGALAVIAGGSALTAEATTEPPAAPAGPTSEAGGTIDFAATTDAIELSDDQLAALEGQRT